MTGQSDLSTPNAGAVGSSLSSSVGDHARGLADDLKANASAAVDDRKAEGAERLHGISETVDKIADEVATESPATADFVRKAARGLDEVSRELKTRSVGDLLDMAKLFASREPAAFMAASSIAGFALARVLKSTARDAPARRPMSGMAAAEVRSGSEWREPGVAPASSSEIRHEIFEDAPLRPAESGSSITPQEKGSAL